MLRALAVVLLLANLGVLAWSQGLFGSTEPRESLREPERLKRQVNPELVKVVPSAAASAALAAAAREAAASEAAAAASAVAAAGTCLEAGPVPASLQPAVEKLLRESAGLAAGDWALAPAGERKGSFMIYMGKYADDEALERKVEELKRLRIEAKPMENAPDLQPGLVIGRFDDKTAAEAELGRLSQRGLRTARVVTLVPAVPLATVRVPAATQAQRDKLLGQKLPNNGPAFAACAGARS